MVLNAAAFSVLHRGFPLLLSEPATDLRHHRLEVIDTAAAPVPLSTSSVIGTAYARDARPKTPKLSRGAD